MNELIPGFDPVGEALVFANSVDAEFDNLLLDYVQVAREY